MPTAHDKTKWTLKLDQLRRKYMDRQDELLVECKRALVASPDSWADLGRRAGLTGGTIRRLADGDTHRPAFTTVLSVLSAMGYTITIEAPDAKGAQKVVAKAPPFDNRVAAARRHLRSVA